MSKHLELTELSGILKVGNIPVPGMIWGITADSILKRAEVGKESRENTLEETRN